MDTNMQLLEAAHRAYMRCGELRSRRDRCKRFTYGDQWSDPADGSPTAQTERQQMLARGYKPLSNNLIRQLVKCIIGRWRYQREQSPAELSAAAQRVYDANELDELDCRTLEEFLISGCAIQRVVRENRPGGGVMTYVDMVSPARFFVNATSDPRGRDIEMVGMLHDMSLSELLSRFGGDAGRRAELLKLYGDTAGQPGAVVGAPMWDDDTFHYAGDGRCRVIEVWTLECRERLVCHDRLNGRITMLPQSEGERIGRLNERRRRARMPGVTVRRDRTAAWHSRYLAPNGMLLGQSESAPGRGHPFAVKLYPLTDGEVHPLVEDVIDQQIYVNRLITLLDRVMTTSAKGALLFPQNQLGDGMTLAQVARSWAAPDSVIPYRPIPGQPEPRQLVTNATDIGARELLEVQMHLFERISGVSDALQGRVASAATGSQMYDNQVRNALISITDLLETFDSFVRRRNSML